MSGKKLALRLAGAALALALTAGFLPTASRAADAKTQAYIAYYEYLRDEAADLGEPIRESDYYKMFTDEVVRDSRVEKILAARLLDVTGDGVEELFLKRYVTNTSKAEFDSGDTEWICIYSFVNGKLKRIGQTLSCVKSAGNGSWFYYEPAGFVGDILSFYQYPYISDDCLYYCRGADGKIYLADGDPTDVGETTRNFFAYNGSLMATSAVFTIDFSPNWSYKHLYSAYGSYLYYINRKPVTESRFNASIRTYYSGGYLKLTNNDYNLVLNKLKQATSSYYKPSAWAAAEVDEATRAGYVPVNLQKNYTAPITRAEFCALAVGFYEEKTGAPIGERASFGDTTDEDVLKMGGLGVVNGTGGGNFSPNRLLTRQEAATILARLAAALGTELPAGTAQYADDAAIADWARAQVCQMAAAGVMNGVAGGRFAPLASYTREQAVLTVLRLGKALPA